VHGAGRTMPACTRWRRSRIATLPKAFPPGRLRDALNAHLRPHPVAVLSAEIVPDTFEARFSRDQSGTHLYRIAKRIRLIIGVCRWPGA